MRASDMGDVVDVTAFQCIVEIMRCLSPEKRLMALVEASLATKSADPAQSLTGVLTLAAAHIVKTETARQA